MDGEEGVLNGIIQILDAIDSLKVGGDALNEGINKEFIPALVKINDSISNVASGAVAAVNGKRNHTGYYNRLFITCVLPRH